MVLLTQSVCDEANVSLRINSGRAGGLLFIKALAQRIKFYRLKRPFISFTVFTVVHVVDDIRVEFSWARGRLFHEQACRVLCDTCLEVR